jgi:hypothetical protein
VYQPFQIDLNALCNGNMDQPFLIEVYDWDANSRHDFIGSAQTTIRECQIMKDLHLKNPKRRAVSKVIDLLFFQRKIINFSFFKIAGSLHILRLEPQGAPGANTGIPGGAAMSGGAPAGGY